VSKIPPAKLGSLVLHPPEIPALLRDSIRDAVDRSARHSPQENGEIIPEFLRNELRAAGAFNLVLPRSQGGPETTLATSLQVYEDFGRLDARIAWSVWNENFSWIASLLDGEGVAAVWGDGSKPPLPRSEISGTARRVEGGYRVSGRWRAKGEIGASGWLVVLAVLEESAVPHLDGGGVPGALGFVLHRNQLAFEDNEIIVTSAFVAGGLAAGLDSPPRIKGSPYRSFLPALALPGCTAVALGVARSAVETMARTVQSMATSAESMSAEVLSIRSALASSEVALRETRKQLHSAAGDLDRAAERQQPVTGPQRESLREAVSNTAQVSRQVLMLMYEISLSYAPIHGSNPLELLIQDSMPVFQHAHQSAAFLGVAGQVQVGIGRTEKNAH
jgi:alkylation response protein AidB-like acyl-CoA dehydrogenase